METKTKHPLQCEAVARAFGLEPRPGRPGDGRELFFRCPRHDDRDESLKVNPQKNADKGGMWMCGPCGTGGNAWELAAFLLGKSCKWEGLGETDQKEVSAWLHERGLLAERGRPSREAGKRSYPILREHIYRDNAGNPVARRTRHDAPPEEKGERFKWWHLENAQWRPGFRDVNSLPLYIGVPAPGDKNTFLRCLERLAHSTEVTLCEGEHDADAGASVGLAAVTSGGTSSLEILRRSGWDFRDKDVVIVAHPGPKELEFAEKAAAILHSGATRVRIIKPCEFWPGNVKDLADIVEGMSAGGYCADTVLHACRTARDRAPEWKPITGAQVLDAVYDFFNEWLSGPDSIFRVLTLWAANSYVYWHWRHAPLLHVYSPEPNCGKTTLLKLLRDVAANTHYTDSASESAVFRRIDQDHPTMLLDEMDTVFKGKDEGDKQLQRLLNSVFEKGANYDRSEQVGKNYQVRSYDVFCPVALATIRSSIVPNSTRSRAIPILMQRLRGKPRRRETEEEIARAHAVGAKLAAWMHSIEASLRNANPLVPKFEVARQVDISEPLLAIAEVAGENWPELGRGALFELLAGSQAANKSPQGELLGDIKRIFYSVNENGEPSTPRERISSIDLGCALGRMADTGWPSYGGRSVCKHCGLHHITPGQIKRLLADYTDPQSRKIEPRDMRIEGRVVKGYERTWFEDAWRAYHSGESEVIGELEANSAVAATLPLGATGEVVENKAGKPPCCAVAAKSGLYSDKEPFEIVRASEWRSERGGQRKCSAVPRITFLDINPNTLSGRAGLPRLVVGGRETTARDLTGAERRPADLSHTERAMVDMGGIEKRGK